MNDVPESAQTQCERLLEHLKLGSPPMVSRNTHRTKGRKFASQKSRANRRKAARR